ncbi:MAG: hypothetical protein Q4G13_06875 [Moraxella sp.]|nr:hypothetical protein [Moraxella sp.]
MKLLKTAAATVLLNVSVFSTSALANYCIVQDPTGTPLNVRAIPNGKVIGQLYNGTLIAKDYQVSYDSKRRAWAAVYDYNTGDCLGYVFRKYSRLKLQ